MLDLTLTLFMLCLQVPSHCKRKASSPASSVWAHFKEGDKTSCNCYVETYACNTTNHKQTQINI